MHIYNFNTAPRLLVTEDFSGAVERLKSLKIECHGGTRIWDSIKSVIDMTATDTSETVRIVCFTDGGDQGSIHSFRTIQQAVQDYPHIKLLIIDIDGKLREILGEEEIVQTVTRKQSIVPIVPAIPCSEDDINMISKIVQEVVPYLEELSGLRYYPVPTDLIDEYTLDTYLEKPLHDDRVKDKVYETICELIRFYEGGEPGALW